MATTFRAETLARLKGSGEAALWSSSGGVVVFLGNLLHLLDVECETLRETIDFDEAIFFPAPSPIFPYLALIFFPQPP